MGGIPLQSNGFFDFLIIFLKWTLSSFVGDDGGGGRYAER